MTASLAQALSAGELQAVVEYIEDLPDVEPTSVGGAALDVNLPAAVTPELADEDFAWAKQTYFERCAGCHGTLRKGATGLGLTPDLTAPKGTLGLAAIIFNGTTGGMPDWGKQGFLTQEQTEIMAEYLQIEPPTPPEMSLEQMMASWKVLVPPAERPTEPQTKRDWQELLDRHPAGCRAGGDHRRRYPRGGHQWTAATPCTSRACPPPGAMPT